MNLTLGRETLLKNALTRVTPRKPAGTPAVARTLDALAPIGGRRSTMCALISRTLLCAAAAAATSEFVVDNFTSTEGMFTLTSQVPPVSTTEVSSTNAGVRLDYSSHHLEMYSGFPYAGRLLSLTCIRSTRRRSRSTTKIL